MSLYPRFRDIHMWVGLILLIPMGVMAITGILWNHEKTLGLKPTYEKPHEKSHKPEKHVSPGEASDSAPLTTQPGSWARQDAAISQAVAAAADLWGGETRLERIELKQEPGYGLVVKVKAEKAARMKPDEIVWSVADSQIVEKKGDPAQGRDWAKVVHDLHTGEFFSHDFGFVWSDGAGLSILVLGLTGVVLYVIPLWKKANKKKVPAKGQTVLPKPASAPAVLTAASALATSPGAAQSS